MFFLLIAFIIGIIGAAIVFIGRDSTSGNKFRTFIILTIVYTLVGWWIFYANIPTFAWPLFGGYGLTVFFWWIISNILTSFSGNPLRVKLRKSIWFPLAYIVITIIIAISGSEIFNANSYAGLIGNIQNKTQNHWSQDVQPIDPTHIRLVPREVAIALAKTILSQNGATLGSQFPMDDDHITLQKIVNDYFYLIPLDFKSWTVWTNADYVPAYVKISATDPYAKPMLITGKRMKYTPGAFFGSNLERRLFWKYRNKILMDYSFEENDNGKEFWVITVCKPSIRYWGLVVEGVVIFDPETGLDEYVSLNQIDKNPQYYWVDRVMPQDLVEAYINYWGNLKSGWWNSFWSHINLLVSETPTMNYSSAGRCVFVSPVTSSNEKDQAMTGLMYTDARTGVFTYYATSGGATEEAVEQAVNSVIGYKHWHASEQMVYENVYGKLSTLAPILGENDNYQGLAIVENENKRVAIGINPQEALIEFQKILMSTGGQITTENSENVLEYTGKVSRIGWDISGTGKQYYICFAEFKHSFLISSSMQSELSLTKEGDMVYVKYINSEQTAIPTIQFHNLTLDLQTSKNEQSVVNQMSKRKESDTINAKTK